MSEYTDRIKPTDSGISTYLENLLANKYQIPTFQRDVVWEKENVKKLWDSIYKYYPLGSILVWKTQTKLQSHRRIGGIELPSDFEMLEYQYILDGQQRTTSLLTSLYGGEIAGQAGFNPTLFVDITVESTDLTDDESYKKRFLFWDQIDDRGGELNANKGRQKKFDDGLIVPLREIWRSFGDVERKLLDSGYQDYDHPIRKELRRLKEVLDNYRISFIELKGIEVVEVCQIFERINQEGKPLDIFDIVVAKTFRPEAEAVAGFYFRDLIDEFRAKIEKSNFCNIDDRTLLEITAVLINQELPEANILNVTPRYLNDVRAEHIEAVWDEAAIAIIKTIDFLQNILNIKGPHLVPYRYLYMVLSAFFYKNANPDLEFLTKYFWYMCFHNDDLLRSTTLMRDQVNIVVEVKTSGVYQFKSFLLDRNKLREATYSSRGRMSRAILALLASRQPQDWAIPHRNVVADVYFLLSDKPNLHHVFPTSFVEKQADFSGKHVDSLMNIVFLTQITNLKISDKNPLDYIRDYEAEGFEDVLETHLLTTDLVNWADQKELPQEALNQFVETRVEQFISALRSELDGVQFEVNDSAVQEQSTIDQNLETD